jgi:hypothetical protein
MAIETVNCAIPLEPKYIVALSLFAVVGLLIMWRVFWNSVARSEEKIMDILLNPAFFKTVTVMCIIGATVVLSLACILDGNITGSILSGIVGYVLGQSSHQEPQNKEDDSKKT